MGALYFCQWAYYGVIGWPGGSWDFVYTRAEKRIRTPPYSASAVDRFRAAARRAELLVPEDGRLARTYHDLGTLLWLNGRPLEAGIYLKRALEIFKRVDGPETTWVAICSWRLGELLYSRHREKEGLALLKSAETTIVRCQGESHPVALRIGLSLAKHLQDSVRARRVLRNALYSGDGLHPLEMLQLKKLAQGQ